jgi:hypothetical protein
VNRARGRLPYLLVRVYRKKTGLNVELDLSPCYQMTGGHVTPSPPPTQKKNKRANSLIGTVYYSQKDNHNNYLSGNRH